MFEEIALVDMARAVLEVETCVPIVMGANIGTTITSALVSLTQTDRRPRTFRRAVTIHDSFNWLTVLVLLPVEVIFGRSAVCLCLCFLVLLLTRD